jgi:hypothetical protein
LFGLPEHTENFLQLRRDAEFTHEPRGRAAARGSRVAHRWGRTKRKIGFLTVAAHHDLDREPVVTDATDDVTQDLLDFLARILERA